MIHSIGNSRRDAYKESAVHTAIGMERGYWIHGSVRGQDSKRERMPAANSPSTLCAAGFPASDALLREGPPRADPNNHEIDVGTQRSHTGSSVRRKSGLPLGCALRSVKV